MLENLMGGEVNGSGNPDGRGALNLKIHPWGLFSILLVFQSLQSFSKNCFAFSNLGGRGGGGGQKTVFHQGGVDFFLE